MITFIIPNVATFQSDTIGWHSTIIVKALMMVSKGARDLGG